MSVFTLYEMSSMSARTKSDEVTETISTQVVFTSRIAATEAQIAFWDAASRLLSWMLRKTDRRSKVDEEEEDF